MKKLISLLLALAMLIPLGLVANAEGEFTTEPFYALGWSDFDEQTYPHLDGLVTANLSNVGEFARLSYSGATVMYGAYTDEDVTAFANNLKKTMDSRPQGLRYLHIFGPTKILKLAPDNVLYLDHGVTQLRNLAESILKKYAEIGGKLDGLVVDTEYFGMSAYYIYAGSDQQDNYYLKNKNVYADIVNDPRYATQIRPLLVERGFPFWPNPEGEKSEIYSICTLNKGEEYDLARSIWDTVVRVHINRYVNYWCYEPLQTYFPEASLSDYQSHDSLPWLKLAGITDDGVALTGGRSYRVGTASCFSYYYARPGTSFYENMKQYVGYNDAYFEASAFNTFMYDINFTRHMYEGTDTKQIAPWITYYTYGGQKESSPAYTPYYTELLYHLGMFDPEPFLSYTYVGDSCFSDGRENSEHYRAIQQIKNEIMAELTRVAGFSDRKPICMPQYWNAEFVVSGMYAGGRNIWRVTPNTDEISREEFKVDAKDPTFSVKGQTVTFPGGKILSETAISTAGSVGYWVETDKDVTPIMTSDPDRYAKYPSYLEDFDRYNVGKMYGTYAYPANCWSYTLTNGTANIVASGNGKALSLGGTVTIQNKELPYRITAGDSYAEDQTWEITVTIPEGLSADAEIQLLVYGADTRGVYDRGFKVENGKVYYSENGKYKEMADITPGTYTFRRVMDFGTPYHFACDYILLDAAGQELAKVAEVSVPSFTLIDNISFFLKKVDKDVLFDDYKLYPSGLTTDFELYDATTGMNVKGDATKEIRSKETAYRLSWLNATDKTETATVCADIYVGNTLKEKRTVKTVTMLPGCDGVETGIVNLAAGESAVVYLDQSKDDVPTAPAPTTPTEPAPTEPAETAPTETTPTEPVPTTNDNVPKADNSALVYVLVGIIVLIGVGMVLALQLTKKKK